MSPPPSPPAKRCRITQHDQTENQIPPLNTTPPRPQGFIYTTDVGMADATRIPPHIPPQIPPLNTMPRHPPQIPPPYTMHIPTQLAFYRAVSSHESKTSPRLRFRILTLRRLLVPLLTIAVDEDIARSVDAKKRTQGDVRLASTQQDEEAPRNPTGHQSRNISYASKHQLWQSSK